MQLELKLACANLLVAHIRFFCNLQANVRNYFMQFEEAQTQSLIDSKIMEFEMKSRQGLQVNTLQPDKSMSVPHLLHEAVHSSRLTRICPFGI